MTRASWNVLALVTAGAHARKEGYAMPHFTFSSVVVALATTAACTTTARQVYLGPTSDQCLDVDSDCIQDNQCCSSWCVNSECETRTGATAPLRRSAQVALSSSPSRP